MAENPYEPPQQPDAPQPKESGTPNHLRLARIIAAFCSAPVFGFLFVYWPIGTRARVLPAVFGALFFFIGLADLIWLTLARDAKRD